MDRPHVETSQIAKTLGLSIPVLALATLIPTVSLAAQTSHVQDRLQRVRAVVAAGADVASDVGPIKPSFRDFAKNFCNGDLRG